MQARLIDERVFDELSQIGRKRRIVLVTSLARQSARHRGIVIATLSWALLSIVLALGLCLVLNLGVEWGWYDGWAKPMVALMVLGSPLLVPVVTYPPLSVYTTPRLRELMRGMLVTRGGKPMVCFACGYGLRGRRYASDGSGLESNPTCPECGEPVHMHEPRRRTLPRWRGWSRRMTDLGRLRFGRRAVANKASGAAARMPDAAVTP